MDFYEVADQIAKLLQQQGRLKAVDDEGKGLIWTGEAETKPESTSTQPAQLEVTQQGPPISVESPPAESRSPDAERRQLTVMFCDLE
jgi:hypothetical protein